MKTDKKMGFAVLKRIFSNRPQSRDGASITNTVRIHDTVFPWFDTTVPSFGASYHDEKGQEWKLQDNHYVWSAMGGLSRLASKGPTLWIKYAICRATDERFARREDSFHFTLPTHIIRSHYGERLCGGGAVAERKYETDIYWVTPEQRDCLREIYTHQRPEWENV